MHKVIITVGLLFFSSMSLANLTININCKGRLCNEGRSSAYGSVLVDTSLGKIACQTSPGKGSSHWSIPEKCLSNVLMASISGPSSWALTPPKYKIYTIPMKNAQGKTLNALNIKARQLIPYIKGSFSVSATYD